MISPKTDLKRALIYIFSLLFDDVLITMILCFVMAKVGISSFVYNSGNYRTYAVTFAVVFVIIILATLRVTLIGLVHLYQHYAPEWMRRRCLCMPTCSEYMIMAIKRYGPFLGTYKGLKRVLKGCNGILFKIDYP